MQTNNASTSSATSPSTSTASSSHHVTLIGDSILDNKAYVRHSLPSVSQLLRKKIEDLNLDWKVTLCAIDGDVMAGVPRQLKTVPKDSDVLVLSIGGNDGLRYLGRLTGMGINPINFVKLMAEAKGEFTQNYADTLDLIVRLRKRVVVCTIYYPCFTNWAQQKAACAGLYVINGIITSEAAKRGLPVIDLAKVFDKNEDYANPIEPGVLGADKLTNNIVHIVRNHAWEDVGHAVYADRTYSVNSADELRDQSRWRNEPRAQRLGRWEWEVEDKDDNDNEQEDKAADTLGALPDLADNDPFRQGQ